MLCPAASCFPLLRGLPALPCLLSWAQHGDGDTATTATTATWPAASSSTGTGVNQDTLTPPICPEKHTPPSLSPPRNKHKHAQLGYIPSQRQRTDSVNTDQGEAEASQLQLQAACICPCSSLSCRWQGTLGDVVPHLIQSHQQLVTQREGAEVVFPFNTSTSSSSSSSSSSSAAAAEDNATTADWVMLQSCFRRTFVLVVKRAPAVVAGGGAGPGPGQVAALFHATVLFVGLSEEAEGFVYRLELRGNRRRLMWEATPRAIQDSAASTFVPMTTTSALVVASDCMTFDLSVAELFTQDSQGTLALHVSISRAWSSTTDTTDPIPRHSQERTPTHRQLIARVHPTSRMQESPLT